jgi:ribosomal protein S18 acetylase RimI-like enzyme
MSFVLISTLGPAGRQGVRRILGGHAHFRLYFEAAIEAGADKESNRMVLIGADAAGLALSIDFERLTIRTTVGRLSKDELLEAVATSRAAELHLEPAHLIPALSHLGERVVARKQLRYYRLDAPTGLTADARCRRLGPADERTLREFFKRHYPATVFSAWMLSDTFLGLFEADQLLACGGVIIRNRRLRAANIGNFLTHPDHRGRGLAKAVVSALIHALEDDGLRIFLLGVTEDNLPAWRAYESVGFRAVEARPQLNVRAVQ